MGQKVDPNRWRMGVNDLAASSNWVAKKGQYANTLVEDKKIRDFFNGSYTAAVITKIVIERPGDFIKVSIVCARPGVIIGKKGGDVGEIKRRLNQLLQVKVHVTVEEVKKPELESKVVAASIAQQIEKRSPYRKVMKRAVQNIMRAGAKGVRIELSGRLGGAEIARSEKHREGRVPLQTIRADISYTSQQAPTTYGIIGIKLWIYRGDYFPVKKSSTDTDGEVTS
ncbi:MAG: 30S ribosomal protein S3 [Legionellales bacterium]|nr:30S ribosomal protein S3 [Legionellales bacterium]